MDVYGLPVNAPANQNKVRSYLASQGGDVDILRNLRGQQPGHPVLRAAPAGGPASTGETDDTSRTDHGSTLWHGASLAPNSHVLDAAPSIGHGSEPQRGACVINGQLIVQYACLLYCRIVEIGHECTVQGCQ